MRVFAAQTVRWCGIFAVRCWIVLKAEGAAAHTRYDYTAWGEPIRMNGFEPDGRWFGRAPEVVFAAAGPAAAALIPRMEAAIAGYAWRNRGDYRPGPARTPTPSPRRSSTPCRGSPPPCRRQRLARTTPTTAGGCARRRLARGFG